MNKTRHPMQPVELDDNGVTRFKVNPIVVYLLDNGGLDLNDIAGRFFDPEDQEHFAQLIGYSVSGWQGLSYVSDESARQVDIICEGEAISEAESRVQSLQETLDEIRLHLRSAATAAFAIHPDDLQNRPQ